MSSLTLFKALLTPRKGLAAAESMPPLLVERKGVHAPAEALARYRALCGFRADGRLPPTYPQLLAGDLHIELLARPEFPLSVAGIVHLENRIVEHAALPEDAILDLEVRLERLYTRDDVRGTLFDLETRALRGGRVVWEATTTVLHRSKADRPAGKSGRGAAGKEPPPAGLPQAPLRTAFFHLPADLGRRYAALAGDFNPIHLSALTARPFGFPRAIIHGMWTLGRCVAEMTDELPAYPRQIGVRFERPVLLPSRVHLAVDQAADDAPGLTFQLTSPDLRTRHLRGHVRAQ